MDVRQALDERDVGPRLALPDLAESMRKGMGRKVGQVLAAVSFISRRTTENGRTTLEIPLVIRDGLVSVGIVPVGSIPALRLQ